MKSKAQTLDSLYQAPQCVPVCLCGRDSILLELSNYGSSGNAGAGFGGGEGGGEIIVGGDF